MQAGNDGDLQADLLGGLNDAFGDQVAAHDTAEDVHEDRLHIGGGGNELEGVGHALGGGTAAHVEEVRRRTAVQLDDVHRCHGKAGTVHHAADVAIERDIVEVELLGNTLALVFLAEVALLGDRLLAIERVFVEVELGIEGEDVAFLGDDHRVDLDHRGITLDQDLVDAEQRLGELLALLFGEVHEEGEFTALERLEASRRMHGDRLDLLRVLLGHFFNVHAAFGRGHEDDALQRAVDQGRHIQLAGNGAGLFHPHAVDGQTLGVGLLGDQARADHLAGRIFHGIEALDELHAAGLAAAAGMHLRLDDKLVAANFLGHRAGLFGAGGKAAFRHGNAVAGEEGLRLVFVKIHGDSRDWGLLEGGAF